MRKLTDFQIVILFLLIGTPLLTIFLILVYMCGIGASWWEDSKLQLAKRGGFMKLKECLELGKECGLTTWEDCYVNVDLHAMCIFKYDEINKEILELQKDMFAINPDKFCEIFNATKDDLINKGWDINEKWKL